MSINRFEQWKHRFENTKPIRGRKIEIRPWGERRRDWEQVVRVLTPYGESYGARLYDTDCVVVAPNGDMFVRTNGWATPTTAEWIRYRSGLNCYKKYNKVWIEVDGRSIPVEGNALHIKYNPETDKYTCDKEVKMEQKVVDKSKIKEVRQSTKDIKSFVRVMMKLADGWVSNELVKKYRVIPETESGWYRRYHYELMGIKFDQYSIRSNQMSKYTAEELIECMQKVEADEDKVQLMLILTDGMNSEDSRIIGTEEKQHTFGGNIHKYTEDIREYKYNPDAVVRRIDYIIKKGADVFTTKEVDVTRPMTNLS